MPSSFGRMLELLFEGIFIVVFIYFARRWLRGRTTREIMGRPASFFERLRPSIESYGDAESTETRGTIRSEATRLFEKGLGEHRLDVADFRLELSVDEIGLGTAHVHRLSDDKRWSLQEFDDYLLSVPLDEARAARAS